MTSAKTSKLSLRTETVMPLQPGELAGVHGGTLAASSVWCFNATIAASQSSNQCAQKAGETADNVNGWAHKHLHFSL